jgi:RNA polymerase sigma-70 factor (ECF subfamily)
MRPRSQDRSLAAEFSLEVPSPIARSTPRKAMDQEAFQVFYERTAPSLVGYLLRVSADRDVADDLVQESYCRFLAADLPPMNEAESKSYLFRIATNLLHDRWRRAEKAGVAQAGEGPSDQRLETRTEVRRAFERLRARERQLLWLAYVEGSNHQEIAQLTGLRPASIRPLLFRARRKLADLLRQQAGRSKES